MDQGTHQNKDNVYVGQSSIKKHILGGFDSNNKGSHGWFPRGIQNLEIDMRNINGNDPIMWIF